MSPNAYNNQKTDYLIDCGDGMYRMDNGNGNTYCEGTRYGILLTAYHGKQIAFEGLWKSYQNNLDNNELMNWNING